MHIPEWDAAQNPLNSGAARVHFNREAFVFFRGMRYNRRRLTWKE